MEQHIYRGSRGIGKTRWLIEQAAKEIIKGKEIYYLGTESSYNQFAEKWLRIMQTHCPIEHIKTIDKKSAATYLTDNYHNNFDIVKDIVDDNNCTWYFTDEI